MSRNRLPPDAALVRDQLAGQRPNERAVHDYRLREAPDGGVATVAINRRESTLAMLFHVKQIGEDELAAGVKLRSWLEKSHLHSLRAQSLESVGGSSEGDRVPSPSQERYALGYVTAIRALSQPRLAIAVSIGASREVRFVAPAEVVQSLIAENLGIRAIEGRYRLEHGSGPRRLRAALNLLAEFFNGQLEVKPPRGLS